MADDESITIEALQAENARLFQELDEANRALDEASRHKSQFLANDSGPGGDRERPDDGGVGAPKTLTTRRDEAMAGPKPA